MGSIIGFLAVICTTSATIPQVIKSLKSKETKDISLGMFLLIFIGVSLWLVYGIIKTDCPLIFANTITVMLSGPVIILKMKYG